MIFSVALVILVLDRITKFAVTKNLLQGHSIKIMPGIFHITLISNNGTAFGLFRNQNTFFIIFSALVIISIIAYSSKARPARLIHLQHRSGGPAGPASLALGLILGGAIGNLVDRIKFGYIIDFLDFRIWPVFNIADSAITIGVIILIWSILTKRKY